MNFGAQLNTSGCVSMYHIAGITPEAPTVEAAVGSKKIKREIVITDKDLRDTRERLCNEIRGIKFLIRPLEEAVEAAISGKVVK